MNRMPNPLQMQSRHLMIAVAASSMILGACRYRETAPQPREATPCVGRTVPVSAMILPVCSMYKGVTLWGQALRNPCKIGLLWGLSPQGRYEARQSDV